MIQLASYGAMLAANLLTIYLMPAALADEGLRAYTVCSALVSVLIYSLFSASSFATKALRRWFVLVLAFAVVVMAGIVAYYSSYVAIGSGAALVVAHFSVDFLLSLGADRRALIAGRLIFASGTALLFLLISDFPVAVIVRLVLAFFLVALCPIARTYSKQLQVSSPIAFVASTHLVYFGSLYAVTIIASGTFLKWLFIVTQLLSQAFLRLIDLEMRG